MPITSKEVMEVLGDGKLHSIRFTVGPLIIDHYAYEKVHDMVASGAVRVKGSKNDYSQYIPLRNLFIAADRNPPLTIPVRANILHECTHIISDYSHAEISRLTDEVAAYLAQMTYHLLLEPTYEAPSLRLPLNNMVRFGIELVKKYKLGQPDGNGASISRADIDSMERMINHLPDYATVKPGEMLDADGIDMEGDVLDNFLARQKVRKQRPEKSADAEEVERLIRQGAKIRIVAYENYVTDDEELLELFALSARGSAPVKDAVRQKLHHIFSKIDQRSAAGYRARLSAAKKGDVVSEKFHASFAADARTDLLAALAAAR